MNNKFIILNIFYILGKKYFGVKRRPEKRRSRKSDGKKKKLVVKLNSPSIM